MTNPQRYQVLHSAGRELVDALSRDYLVDIERGPELDEDFAREAQIEEAVRLRPRSGGAPLTVAFTAFPGLLVRYGEWHVEAYPACGCDACDEEPAEVIDRFRTCVGVVVGEGFTESLTHGWRRTVLAVDLGGIKAETRRPRRRDDEPAEAGVRSWPPW